MSATDPKTRCDVRGAPCAVTADDGSRAEPQADTLTAHHAPRTSHASAASTGITRRAVLLGGALIPPACWWLEYTECVSEGTDMAGISYVLPALFLLFLLTTLNRWAAARRPSLALGRGELLTIYIMLSAGLTLGGPGGMQHLVMALAAVRWHTEGREWVQPYLPEWLFPPREALRDFYRGAAARIPWEAWLLPALAWGLFIFALVVVMLCLAVLFRPHWSDHERLTYPLVFLPLEMTGGAGARGEQALGDGRLFWTAVAVTVALESLNSLAYLYPSLPSLPIKPVPLHESLSERPWSALGYFCVAFYPMVIGICYLISLEILFSYAVFYLLTKAQLVGVAALGWSDGDGRQLPYLSEQGAGAWVALGLAALWLARRTIASGVRPGGPAGEAISYRAACLGAAGGLLFLVIFARAAGLSLTVAIGVLALYLLFVIAAARIRAEAGTAWLFSPAVNPAALVVAARGATALPATDLVGLATFQWFMLNTECVAMPYYLEGFRMTGSRDRPALFRAILLASAAGVVAAFGALLSLYYQYGAGTAKVEAWRTAMGNVPWERLEAWQHAGGVDPSTLEAAGAGMAVVGLLTALRLRFLWWPLHPIGYAAANTWTMAWLWFPCFLTWVLKGLILRYGGLTLYRRWLPFFLGLILGDYLAGAAWAILGAALDIKIYRIFVI